MGSHADKSIFSNSALRYWKHANYSKAGYLGCVARDKNVTGC